MDSEVVVVLLINKYLQEVKKNSFTYNELRCYYYKNKLWNLFGRKYDWHTIERCIRKLANIKILDRYRYKNKTYFKFNKDRAIRHIIYKMIDIYGNIITLPDNTVILNYKGREYVLNNTEEAMNIVRLDVEKMLR